MVVADQGSWQADVVFVIEGTANLSPYIESLKANYILPTLEYFNGAPSDDRDCGCDPNSTMYALVVFMAADCAPETAATCYPPTPNTHKFLSWLDKVQFVGGAGESHSHIAEGLSTVLQVFDDFQVLRENNINTQKHCILVCNSPPYPLPSLESSSYCGLMIENLAALMEVRQINFSVLSPRKIPALFKLYEKAGGDLQHALAKNYAKDRRHLVLLRGFQLQERPMSPPTMDNKVSVPPNASVCSPPATGQKRPATNSPPHNREAPPFKQPAAQTNYNSLEWNSSEAPNSTLPNPNQVQPPIPPPVSAQSTLQTYGQGSLPGQPNQPLSQRSGIPTPPSSHLNSLNQPNPPNVTITNKGPPTQHTDGIRPTRGHSPVPPCGPRISWNQAASSPPASTPPTSNSVLANQLNMPSSNLPLRHNAPQMQPNQAVPNLVSQAQPMNPAQNVLNQPGALQRNLCVNAIRMSNTSPGPGPVPNPGANPLTVQINQHQSFGPNAQQAPPQSVGMPSAVQPKLGSVTSGNQMMPSQGQPMTTVSSTNMGLQSVPGGMLPMSQGTSQQGQQPANPTVNTKDRRTIWQGIIEFHEKSLPTTQAQLQQKVSHSLSCTFSSMVTNGESDVIADKWPNRLILQLIPRQLFVLANLFNTLKTAARHILIHFNQESEALAKLCKMMSSSLVGCIQFPQTCETRIMVVLYMPDKRIYMGFIANDQESFFNNIRQMYENHRKSQQQKQRMQQQQLGNNMPSSDGMVLSSANAANPNMMINQPPAANINPNANQMASRMPMTQQQVAPNNPPPQGQAPNTTMVHSTNINQQQPSMSQAARLNQLEAARQQNLLKIQQLQQTLEAAQQKELQFKAAQEQQQQQQQQAAQQQQQQMIDRQNAIRHLKMQQLQQNLEAAQQKELQYKAAQEQQQQQHQQQQMMDTENVIRHLQQQLHQQQQQLAQQQQQSIQMQQQGNPQLRNLLQQQAVQQQMRRQQQQQQQHMLMQQHPQGIRPQMAGNIPQGNLGASVGPQQQQQQPQPQQQQSWADSALLDMLP